jgi:hypothetical protein
MNQDQLLRTIAETGYNVGFGAKKTFATYDIIEKGPGWIGFISFVVGLFGLIYEALTAKVPSAILLTAGVAALYISQYRGCDYEDAGNKLTKLFNRLRILYADVKSGADLKASKAKLTAIQTEYYATTVGKQIFLSDWYAHYKFFAQMQIDWMDEQLHFGWWKDKIPLSAKIVVVLLGIALIGGAGWFIARQFGWF